MRTLRLIMSEGLVTTSSSWSAANQSKPLSIISRSSLPTHLQGLLHCPLLVSPLCSSRRSS